MAMVLHYVIDVLECISLDSLGMKSTERLLWGGSHSLRNFVWISNSSAPLPSSFQCRHSLNCNSPTSLQNSLQSRAGTVVAGCLLAFGWEDLAWGKLTLFGEDQRAVQYKDQCCCTEVRSREDFGSRQTRAFLRLAFGSALLPCKLQLIVCSYKIDADDSKYIWWATLSLTTFWE